MESCSKRSPVIGEGCENRQAIGLSGKEADVELSTQLERNWEVIVQPICIERRNGCFKMLDHKENVANVDGL